MSKYIFINGKLVIENKARIPVKDRGFLYGDGLFETIRGYSGFVFILDAHLQRLFSSLNILKYNIKFDKPYVRCAIQKIIDKNKLNELDAYIKVIVTRGIYKGKVHFRGLSNSNLIIIAHKLIPYPEINYREGVKVISYSIKRMPIGNLIYLHKLLNYFENIFARDETYQNEAQEAIFLTKDHLVLEGVTSNIFYVKNNIIYAPSLTQNILPGITSGVVLDICGENNTKLRQRKIHYFDITEADEVFMTNSIMEIMHVREIDKYRVRGKITGYFTTKLMHLYKERVSSEREIIS